MAVSVLLHDFWAAVPFSHTYNVFGAGIFLEAKPDNATWADLVCGNGVGLLFSSLMGCTPSTSVVIDTRHIGYSARALVQPPTLPIAEEQRQNTAGA